MLAHTPAHHVAHVVMDANPRVADLIHVTHHVERADEETRPDVLDEDFDAHLFGVRRGGLDDGLRLAPGIPVRLLRVGACGDEDTVAAEFLAKVERCLNAPLAGAGHAVNHQPALLARGDPLVGVLNLAARWFHSIETADLEFAECLDQR